MNSISDNDLYALIIFSCAKNENIIIQINDMIIKLIENLVKNIMKQSSSGDYNKYRNNLLKINKINHLNRHSGNILIVKYYDKNNKEESHSFKSYFAKILNNLSLINYNELNNEMDTNNIQNDEQLLSFVSDYNTNKRNTFLKKIINQTNKYINTINNIENIKVQSCIIDKNILNKECMEEYKQIINDLVENCCPILKECKPLINDIGNKAKKLLNEELQETDGNSLNKSSKNEKTINMSEMEFNQIIQTAREKGMQEGLKLGKMQGKEKGMKDGIIEGENNKAMEIAKNLFDMKLSLDMKLSIEQISQATGLSIDILSNILKLI